MTSVKCTRLKKATRNSLNVKALHTSEDLTEQHEEIPRPLQAERHQEPSCPERLSHAPPNA